MMEQISFYRGQFCRLCSQCLRSVAQRSIFPACQTLFTPKFHNGKIAAELYCDKYYKLLIDIRNYGVLSADEFDYIDTLPKYKLIEIIKIYNTHIENINQYISNNLK